MEAIGRALAEGGEFRLWSCDVASGATGETFVDALGEASGAAVAAADRRVGAAALGGTWELPGAARPPLTAAGMARYVGVLDHFININTHGLPVSVKSGSYSIVTRTSAGHAVLGEFTVLNGRIFNILVKLASRQPSYAVYAGPADDVPVGRIAIANSSGNYSRQATTNFLGADGAVVSVRAIDVPVAQQGARGR